MSAKQSMNGTEIFPGAGPVRINFAKPPSPSGTPGPDGTFPSPSPDPFKESNGDAGVISRPGTAPLTIPALPDMKSEILKIVTEFGATSEDKIKITHSLERAIGFQGYQSEIPTISEPSHNRIHDAPKLRDIRKRIDNQSWSQAEIENIATEMLPEIAELSSDYLGNTVVQKLFEHCSDDMRDAMLAEIAPHMAEIGVHKNGTWAAQKIIECCKKPAQMSLIMKHLQPYTVPLFLDQYGNYVLQCCLKFGSPYNDFIFESMLSQMWEIAQGRYGARAMRACLESHHSTKEQQRMLAAAIALHSVQLATNANGALLLTWFLDTCTFPQRRTVLAPQLVPNLVHLCTHKVAYLTVLKVINQKLEADARDTILQSLFFSKNDETLEAILSDHACGATLIFKVLTTPFFDEAIRSDVVENVRNVLLRLKAQPAQGYKRLMDEVGLSTRNGSAGPREQSSHSTDRQRPGSNHSQAHAPPQYANQFYPQMPGYDMGMQRTDSADSNLPYPAYGQFNPTVIPPINMQQLQYQQQLLARAAPPMSNFYPAMQSGFGYNSPSMDNYRNQTPIQPPQPQMNSSPFGPPGFGNVGMGYGYGMGMQNMGYMQQEQQVNSRRGRVTGREILVEGNDTLQHDFDDCTKNVSPTLRVSCNGPRWSVKVLITTNVRARDISLVVILFNLNIRAGEPKSSSLQTFSLEAWVPAPAKVLRQRHSKLLTTNANASDQNPSCSNSLYLIRHHKRLSSSGVFEHEPGFGAALQPAAPNPFGGANPAFGAPTQPVLEEQLGNLQP
ncbi:hypothetical protein VTL71DRAFT_4956 [Oculimacula yallundae]|uniref:PUM-HD domain-containing protein n=1 Tax=Oculimacula yallundae TaxID=86028 RepID=A0ABR4C3E3_9HELO